MDVVWGIIEWCIVVLMCGAVIWPYGSYYAEKKTLRGSLVENGGGYRLLIETAMEKSYVPILGIVIYLLTVSMMSMAIAIVTWLWVVSITVAIVCAEKTATTE